MVFEISTLGGACLFLAGCAIFAVILAVATVMLRALLS